MIKKLRQVLDSARGDESAELKPFLEHLEDLRVMVIRCAVAIGVGFFATFWFAPEIVDFLQRPLRPLEATHDHLIRSGDNVAGGFNLAMMVGFWSGLLLASPFLIYFIARFVLPALTDGEKRVIRQTTGLGFVALVFGLVLGWFYGLPAALNALIWFNDWMHIETWWTINNYISFATLMLVAFGCVFEIPVVILILGRLGLVSSAWLRKYRRHSIVGALVVAAIITPSPDSASQLMIAGPLIVLYEACIWLIYAHEKKRKAELAVRENAG